MFIWVNIIIYIREQLFFTMKINILFKTRSRMTNELLHSSILHITAENSPANSTNLKADIDVIFQ